METKATHRTENNHIGTTDGRHSLSESLGYLANSVGRAMRIGLETKLKEHGITTTGWLVLQGLSELKQATQTDLARSVDLDNATVTRQLDRMESAGLILRKQAKDDRRAQTISLSAKGKRLLPLLNAEANSINTIAMRGLTDARQRRLLIDLARIRENMREHISS